MLKSFGILLLLCFGLISQASPTHKRYGQLKRSSLFLGAQLGANLNHLSMPKNTNKTYLDTTYGLAIGYEGYFGPYGGARFYANVNYENIHLNFDDTPLSSGMLHYGINADYLFEFLNPNNPTGAFFGVGYQWDSSEIGRKLIEDVKNRYIQQQTHGFLLNMGVSQIFFKSNKIELGLRIPLYASIKMERICKMKSVQVNMRSWGNFYLAYSYLF